MSNLYSLYLVVKLMVVLLQILFNVTIVVIAVATLIHTSAVQLPSLVHLLEFGNFYFDPIYL